MPDESGATPQVTPTAGPQPPAVSGPGQPDPTQAGGPSGAEGSEPAAPQPGLPADPQDTPPAPQTAEERTWEGRYGNLRQVSNRVNEELKDANAKLAEAKEKTDLLEKIETQFGGAQALLDDAKTRQAAAAAAPAVPDPPPAATPTWQGAGEQPPDLRSMLAQQVQDYSDIHGNLAGLQFAEQLQAQTGVQLLPGGMVPQAPQQQVQQIDPAQLRQDIVQDVTQEMDKRRETANKFEDALDVSAASMVETYPAEWLDEKIVVPDRPELRHIAGLEMPRRRAAEKLCEATGVPNMSDALVGVDLNGVIELRANQLLNAHLEEQIRMAQGSSELGPGASLDRPLPQDAGGAAIDQQVNAGKDISAGTPETMEQLAARLKTN